MEMKKLSRHMDKRGVLGLDTAKSFILALLTLAVIAFAVIIAMSNLNSSNAGNQDTTDVLNNVSVGVTDLFSNAGTWFSLIAVVVIILVIAIVISAVNRFGGREGGL